MWGLIFKKTCNAEARHSNNYWLEEMHGLAFVTSLQKHSGGEGDICILAHTSIQNPVLFVGLGPSLDRDWTRVARFIK